MSRGGGSDGARVSSRDNSRRPWLHPESNHRNASGRTKNCFMVLFVQKTQKSHPVADCHETVRSAPVIHEGRGRKITSGADAKREVVERIRRSNIAALRPRCRSMFLTIKRQLDRSTRGALAGVSCSSNQADFGRPRLTNEPVPCGPRQRRWPHGIGVIDLTRSWIQHFIRDHKDRGHLVGCRRPPRIRD